MKAKAAVMTKTNSPFDIREYDITTPPKGMAGIELIASGVCGTDVHIHEGRIGVPTPIILGHEFIGRVDVVEDGSHVKAGDNVIVNVATPCCECALCKSGDDANCLNFGVTYVKSPDEAPHLFGGYAEYNYSPIANLIPIPKELDPLMVAVFPCAGPTILHAISLAEKAGVYIKDVKTAVVQGLGPVGLFAVMYLKTMGVENVIALSTKTDGKREQAALKLGADRILSVKEMAQEDLVKTLRGSGIGADMVIEASGNPLAVPLGLELLRNRGTYLLPGQYSDSGTIEIKPQLITFNALRLIGSSQYSRSDVDSYLSFLLDNPDLHQKIRDNAACYKIESANDAFTDAKNGINIKTLLVK